MRAIGWIAALAVCGSLVWYRASGASPADLRLASTERTYARSAADPRPQRLPASATRQSLDVARIIGDSLAWAHPQEVEVVGSHLVVADLRGARPLVRVDRRTGDLRPFARFGRGPGEFLWPRSIEDAGGGRAWIYDLQGARATLYDLAEPELRHAEIAAVPGNLFQTVRMGDTLVANGLFPHEVLRVHARHENGFRLARKEAVTPFSRELPDVVMLIGRTALAADPARRRLVVAYQFRNQLDFFDRHGRKVGSVAGPRDFTPVYRVVPDPREKMNRFVPTGSTQYAYLDVAASERRVYALFSGKARGDGSEDVSQATEVHVFDWDGRLLDVLTLAQPVFRIALDPATGVLYGLRSEPFPGVVEFHPLKGEA
ncbi:MAG TPA: BF3164 family lipoprotein [Longimicrobium sp.]|nr:BF3164 family lipoprotein [Longimicrobium sp.]